jgi:hypothetical protein
MPTRNEKPLDLDPRAVAPAALRTANDRNQLAERPLLDEVVPTHHTQCGEHGAFGPIYRTHYLRLDLCILVWEIKQDNVADQKPLDLDIKRHGDECMPLALRSGGELPLPHPRPDRRLRHPNSRSACAHELPRTTYAGRDGSPGAMAPSRSASAARTTSRARTGVKGRRRAPYSSCTSTCRFITTSRSESSSTSSPATLRRRSRSSARASTRRTSTRAGYSSNRGSFPLRLIRGASSPRSSAGSAPQREHVATSTISQHSIGPLGTWQPPHFLAGCANSIGQGA